MYETFHVIDVTADGCDIAKVPAYNEVNTIGLFCEKCCPGGYTPGVTLGHWFKMVQHQ